MSNFSHRNCYATLKCCTENINYIFISYEINILQNQCQQNKEIHDIAIIKKSGSPVHFRLVICPASLDGLQ